MAYKLRIIGAEAVEIIDFHLDLRLCRFFGLSRGYWLRAQIEYDYELTEETLGETLQQIKPWAERDSRITA